MANISARPLTIFDFLDNPDLPPAMTSEERESSLATERDTIDSCFRELVEEDKYFDRRATESFRSLPGLEQLPLVEIDVRQSVVQCHCISDVHVDNSRNMKWMEEHCKPALIDDHVFNVLVVAGDVSTPVDRLCQLFETLSRSFDAIFYIPGNHDFYLSKASQDSGKDSAQKLVEIYTALKAHPKVHCGPVKFRYGEGYSRELLLFPMHAWYHASWDKEREIENASYAEIQRRPSTAFDTRWLDNTFCRWSLSVLDKDALKCKFGEEIHPRNVALAEAFATQNEHFLRSPPDSRSAPSAQSAIQFFGCKYTSPCADSEHVHAGPVTVISFSHFLPRQELLPEKRFLIEPMLAKVSGSDVLGSQVRRLRPHLHICGHSHVPIDLTLQGIRYLQWPLGSVNERTLQCRPIADTGPLCVFDSQLGDGNAGIPANLASLKTPWSKYYSDPSARRPDVVGPLAPWLLNRIDAMKKIAEF